MHPRRPLPYQDNYQLNDTYNRSADPYYIVNSSPGLHDPLIEGRPSKRGPNVTDGEASWLSTVANTFKTIVGSGMLALPFAMARTGVWVAFVWFILVGYGEAFAVHLLMRVCLREKVFSFRGLAEKTLVGVPRNKELVDVAIALNCFGLACSSMIIIGELLPSIADFAFQDAHRLLYGDHASSFWITVVGLGLAFPLMCLRSLDALRFSSILGVFCVVFITSTTVIYALDLGPEPACTGLGEAGKACPGAFSWGFPGDVEGTLNVLSLYVFAYSCTQNMPMLCFELKRRSIFRIDSATVIAVTFATVFYAFTALAGYYAYGMAVDANLLVSLPSSSLAVLAKGAMTFNVLSSFPLQMHPTKDAVANIIWGEDARSLSTGRYYCLTSGLFIAALMVSMTVSSLDAFLTFVGGTTSMLIGYILPAWFYLQSFKDFGVERVLAWVVLVTSTLLVPAIVGIEIWKLTIN